MLHHPSIRRALISVWDKTGIVAFARALHDEFGVEILSTGGTAKTLREAGISVSLVEDVTGFPEMLDGRVKTLHPRIHAGILADRDNPEHMRQLAAAGIEPIDMVVVDLYPFERVITDPACTFEQAIEMIDIGGVTLLRAAAKNHRFVLVVGPGDYDAVLRRLRAPSPQFSAADRRQYAFAALWQTAGYDAAISAWMSRDATGESRVCSLRLLNSGRLRYGENPHQTVELWRDSSARAGFDLTDPGAGFESQQDWRDRFSSNNILDADAALGLCAELTRAAAGGEAASNPLWYRLPAGSSESRPASSRLAICCFIKHTNACGVGVHEDPLEAYERAYLGDPNAAMGGVLACNFPVDAGFAAAVLETYDRLGRPLKEANLSQAPGGFFVEVWVAPAFSADAEHIIRGTYNPASATGFPYEARIHEPPKKKWGENVRLLTVGDMDRAPVPSALQFRSIAGGMLAQSPDRLGLNEEQWKVVTKRSPDVREMADLRLAWLICKHTKSNAITLCRDSMLIGNGAGQMSRVMSCRIATWLARDNGHADRLPGSAAASDAFFPFRDGPDLLMEAGVTAIIQPGGSKRDEETIAACNEREVAMIFTGTRHFKH